MYIILYLLFGVHTLVFFVAMCVVWALTVWWDGPRRVVHALSRVWAMGYFRLVPGWRPRVEGVVPRGETFVVVVNHRSMVDIVLMYALPVGNFKWVSKREVYRWPLFGWVLWMHGDVAIERGSASGVRQMMRQGGGWLRRGVSMMVFPEGTRSRDAGLGRFHEGAFMLARQAGVRVLPVVASGTDSAFVGGRFNLRNRFVLKILPPMEPEMEAVRAAMEAAMGVV